MPSENSKKIRAVWNWMWHTSFWSMLIFYLLGDNTNTIKANTETQLTQKISCLCSRWMLRIRISVRQWAVLSIVPQKLTQPPFAAFYELILVDLHFPPHISFSLGGVLCLLLGVGNAISIQVSRILLQQTRTFSYFFVILIQFCRTSKNYIKMTEIKLLLGDV